MHPTLAQFPVFPSRSCHVVTVFGADISDQIAQRRNANTRHQLGKWVEFFFANDFSEMRPCLNHDFRFLVASVVAFFESLSVA